MEVGTESRGSHQPMTPRPPLLLLETLAIFSEEKTFVRTAEKLRITQPTVTRHLQELQKYFSVPILTSLKDRKILTPFGMSVAESTKSFVKEMYLNVSSLEQTNQDSTHIRLKVGGRQEYLEYFFAGIKFPGILEFSNERSDTVLSGVETGKYDLSVSFVENNSLNLSRKLLKTVDVVFAVPKKFAPTKPSAKDWAKSCHNYPACAYSNDLHFYSEFSTYFPKFKVPRIRFLFQDWKMLENRVRLQSEWAILPSLFIESASDYWTIPLEKTFPIYLYYRKDFSKMKWFKEFINQLT